MWGVWGVKQGTHQLNGTTHCERASVPAETAWSGGSMTDRAASGWPDRKVSLTQRCSRLGPRYQTCETQGKSLAESQYRPNPQSHTTTITAYLFLENPLVWDACEKGTVISRL